MFKCLICSALFHDRDVEQLIDLAPTSRAGTRSHLVTIEGRAHDLRRLSKAEVKDSAKE
jgi:hypothetical protein